jgi:hypothetical protein
MIKAVVVLDETGGVKEEQMSGAMDLGHLDCHRHDDSNDLLEIEELSPRLQIRQSRAQ